MSNIPQAASAAALNAIREKAVSWSSLKHYDRSPAHYLENFLHPPESTPAMILGSALHCLVLEPDEFWNRYAVDPGFDRRTKAGKEQWAAFEEANRGKELLTSAQYEQIQGMNASIREGKAGRLIARCRFREVMLEWLDPLADQPCKGRIDAYSPEDGIAIDIKTTTDASPKAFPRAVANYLYHGQAAFYLDGLAAKGIEVRRFVFLAIEKEPPYAWSICLCTEGMITAGRALYRGLLDKHAECCAKGEWPGYDDGVTEIELPRWAA